jgi:hypothetical protein
VAPRATAGLINDLEIAPFGCYICAVMASRGWMLRITSPILG